MPRGPLGLLLFLLLSRSHDGEDFCRFIGKFLFAGKVIIVGVSPGENIAKLIRTLSDGIREISPGPLHGVHAEWVEKSERHAGHWIFWGREIVNYPMVYRFSAWHKNSYC